MLRYREHKIQKLDLVLILLLSVIGMFSALYRVNPEFVGNDDYELFVDHLFFGYVDFIPDDFSKDGLSRWFKSNLEIFFRGRHGPSPSIFIGPLYRLMDLSGVPITKSILHLPSGLISTLSAVLLFIFLMGYGFDRFSSLITSVILIASPIYSFHSRSLCSEFFLILSFNQILCLFVICTLGKNTFKSRIFAGLVFMQLVLSDGIFFVLMFITVVSFLYTEHTVRDFTSFTKFNKYLKSDECPLKYKDFWLPPALALMVTIAGTVLALTTDNLRIETLFLTLLQHTDRNITLGSGIIFSPLLTFKYLSLLFGELFSFFLLAIIVYSWTKVGKIKNVSGVWLFGVGTFISYFILWYIVREASYFTAIGYQIYLVVPSLILIASTVRELFPQSKTFGITAKTSLILLLFSSALTTLHFIWHYRTTFLVDIKECRSLDFGRVIQNHGSKATGFLVREIIDNELRGKEKPTHLKIRTNNYDYSLMIYGGFNKFRADGRLELDLPKRTMMNTDLTIYVPLHLQKGKYLNVLMFWGSAKNLDPEHDNFSVYDIFDGNTIISRILIFPELACPPKQFKPGNYELGGLESEFDSKYDLMSDYYWFYPPSSELDSDSIISE